MANKKYFTNESLITFVDETKFYTDSSVNELSTKVSYIEEDVFDTIFWDGNTNGLEAFDMMDNGTYMYYPISNAVVTLENLTNGAIIEIVSPTGEKEEITLNDFANYHNVVISQSMSYVIFAPKDNISFYNNIIPKKGVYVLSGDAYGYVSKITIPEYTGFYSETDMSNVNTGWLKDKNGEKFAPKTLSSQVVNSDGTLFVDNLELKFNEINEKISIQDDWNQRDSSKPDYIKNRTHWTEADEVTIVSENVSVSEEGYGQFSGSIPQLIVGQSYKVILNGAVYECVARAWDEESAVLIGNGTIYGDGNESNGEPFVCDSYANSLYLNAPVGEYNVSILTIQETVYPLDEKYIPYVVGKDVEGKTFTINSDGVEENVTASKGAEIFNNYENNIATGVYSHAEGSKTIASGDYSHAEGLETTASGYYSHAEGVKTTASGSTSHAEGTFTTASGFVSHAEGQQTTASGDYSHSEGDNAIASGMGAHAEGYSTVASGDYSHAEGSSTIASSPRQHVQGKYNVEDTEGLYAHIVGNGTSATRSNAHTLDWDGNAWFAGDVTVGADKKELITEDALVTYEFITVADIDEIWGNIPEDILPTTEIDELMNKLLLE